MPGAQAPRPPPCRERRRPRLHPSRDCRRLACTPGAQASRLHPCRERRRLACTLSSNSRRDDQADETSTLPDSPGTAGVSPAPFSGAQASRLHAGSAGVPPAPFPAAADETTRRTRRPRSQIRQGPQASRLHAGSAGVPPAPFPATANETTMRTRRPRSQGGWPSVFSGRSSTAGRSAEN